MFKGLRHSQRIRLTWRYLRAVIQHRWAFGGMLLCMVVVGVLEPLLPWMLAPLLDSTNQSKTYGIPAGWLPYAMLLLIFARSAFSYGRSYLGGWLDATLQRDYRAAMSEKLTALPASHIQRDSLGALTSRFMQFLPTVTGATMPVCMALVQETIKIIGFISLMLYLQWQLTLYILIIAPIIVFKIRYLKRRMKKAAGSSQQAISLSQSRLNETVQLWQIVKLQGQRTTQQWLHTAFARLRNAMLRVYIVTSAGQPGAHFLLALPFAFIIAYIVGALEVGEMSAGEAASFLTVMLLLPTPIRNITSAINKWEQMLVAAREVFGFLDAPPERDNGTQVLAQVRGAVEFQNITFAYETGHPPALDGVSLHIATQETVALVGRSGGGKSTLTHLIPRFYNPQSGRVLLDGVDLQEITLASLRQNIALVTQTPLLFDDTIAANVAYPDTADAEDEGDDTAQKIERVMQALQNAAADDFVNALPNGVHTRIGEGGGRLSGGQRQRLALARAFYRDAPIIILDEATSALDSETEAKIKQAMQRLLAGRTAVIIAHRFATIDFADRIIVLDRGKILAQGTSAQLRATCPLYNELYTAQQLPTTPPA